jgi:glycerol-3-phosphate acyltransferase PlsY
VPIVAYVIVALVAYLLGSFPTGYLVGKGRGIDIRSVGSGNIGATNVFRILGKPAGIFVLIVDALKGWVAVALVARWVAHWYQPGSDFPAWEWLAICAAICAVLGHNYTCWLQFKGGKGIATSAGVLSALVPWSLVIILGIWIVVFAVSRYVSLASILAAFSLPIATWLTGDTVTMIVVSGIMGALAIYKHKANIKRLLNGTENRFGKKSPAAGVDAPVSKT